MAHLSAPTNSPQPPASSSPPSDFGTVSARPHAHEHFHDGPARAEGELSETAVVWDDELREWRSQDEEAQRLEHLARRGADDRRDAAPDGSEDGTTVGPTATISVEEGEKRLGAGAGHDGARTLTVGTEEGKEVAGVSLAEVVWLEWEPNDRENPFNWSKRKKWQTCLIACFFTLSAAYSGTAFAMGTPSLMRDLNCSREVATLGLSVFPLGFGLGPLFTAPLSEAFGRYPLYVVSSLVYLVFFIPTAYGQNIATVIIARFIGGIAASTGSTLVGGTVSDLFDTHERGLPMAIFSICAFAGTGLGPAVSGYIELKMGWRWISWVQMMLCGVLTALIILFTRETRGSVILSRRARKLRKQTGDPRYQCRSDAERASLAVLMKVSMTRPIYLIFTEAIVFFFSLWVGFSWGCLYLLVEAVPLIFGDVYGFNAGQVGLTFYSVVVASFIGAVSSYCQEKLYRKNVAKRGPEARLYASLVGGLVFPAGAFLLAFSQGRGHWMGPVVGLTMIFTGVYTIYLAVFSYLADCYTIYASSALSGQSLFRNLAAFAFPLFTTQMYDALGYQWASFLAGCIALALSATPWVLFALGPKIRQRSKFAKELARMRGEAV
ncbi:MFS general substrate transporter [Rhodotorula diobovata]|uniref:MFS general substrate transporter n=1 Tax=Rhodotorula diobovata TaxID=5288 RepID=A0A5C5G5D1_9BASI|nr:MFS general substrate transporter [Rhodotorula diobovata]